MELPVIELCTFSISWGTFSSFVTLVMSIFNFSSTLNSMIFAGMVLSAIVEFRSGGHVSMRFSDLLTELKDLLRVFMSF